MTQSRYLSFVEKAATLLLLTYPTLMLAVKGGMNGVFIFMLLLASVVWIVRPAGINTVKWQYEWKAYFVSMVAMSAAILISQSYYHNYAAHPHDAASRYCLVIPMFLLLQRLRPNVFTVLQFAFPVAAIVGFLLAKEVMMGRMGLATLDLIHFGDFELILGVLSLFSIDWFGRDQLLLRILKLLGFVAGLAASLASGSRGGWLAIPVFIAIFIYFKTTKLSLRTIASAVIAVLLTFVLLYTLNTTIHKRVNTLVFDVAMLTQEGGKNNFLPSDGQLHNNLEIDTVTTDQEGNRINVVQNRLRLYNAAIDVFLRHPLFGVGPEGFALEMQPMMEAGKITHFDAEMGRAEVHNDILSKAAGMGVFGLIAILAIYFVPFNLFWRATKSALSDVRCTGFLGIIFVSGFFVFGLTVEILNLTMATAFYSFTVAVLLAACYNIHHDDERATQHLLE